jgi:hypothetical protein
MLSLTSEKRGALTRGWYGDRREPSDSTALLITAVVAVGLGILAWSYLGPDLKRYMKIQSM